MDQPHEHKLRFLHLESSLNRVKLEQLRRVATDVLKDSLLPGQRDSLKVRAAEPFSMVITGYTYSKSAVKTLTGCPDR